MGVEIGEAVERVNGKGLRYSEFVERYLKGNRPVVLTGLMDGWRACRDWVTKDGRPNLSFFSADPFAKSIVQVADCDKREFTDQKRLEMSVSEFIKHWLGLPAEKCGGDLNCNNVTHSLLYLKDWHFNKEHPGYMAYTTPAFFSDDWLNIYLDSHHAHQDSDMHPNRKEVHGPLFMPTFSDHTVGLLTCVGRNIGSFYRLHNVILLLTGTSKLQCMMCMGKFLRHVFQVLRRLFGGSAPRNIMK